MTTRSTVSKLRAPLTLLLSLTLILGLSSFDMDRRRGVDNWEKIGTKVVNFKIDKDVVKVGADDGRFTKLKLAVSGGGLNMHRMVVHYGNGERDEIEVRHDFSKKSASRVIDLKGNTRIIQKITFVYDTKNRAGMKAKLHVFGKH